jgi:hypothetical protein
MSPEPLAIESGGTLSLGLQSLDQKPAAAWQFVDLLAALPDRVMDWP